MTPITSPHTQSPDDTPTRTASYAPTPTTTDEGLYLVACLARWLADVALNPIAIEEDPDDAA